MDEIVKADSAEMARLAHRVAGRAKYAFTGVDFNAAADAVAGTEFAEVLRTVNDALQRAGGGASSRLENISTLVRNSASAIDRQDSANTVRMSAAAEAL